jgi:hypothetical protein
MIDPSVLERRPQGVKRTTMRWPREEPMDSDFDLWREAVEDISPTRLRVHSVGEFVADTHRIGDGARCQTHSSTRALTPLQQRYTPILPERLID